MTIHLFFDDITLDRSNAEGLAVQLTGELRRLIVSQTLPENSRLPSTRLAAEALKIGRNTVIEAYETLVSEGLCEATPGAGTFVVAAPISSRSTCSQNPTSLLISNDATELQNQANLWENPQTNIHLAPGVPALDIFPRDSWARALTKVVRHSSNDIIRDRDPMGYEPLRQAIASHIGLARGISCTADQVMILASARQGFDLAVRLMTKVGESVLVETPGYVEAHAIVKALSRVPRGVENSKEILEVMTSDDVPKLAILTPTHQYPTGRRMSVATQRAVLEIAAKQGMLIVEDDYDGEFYHAKPSPAMASLGNSEFFLHVGTFSKSMFPGLRLAYAIAPPSLVSPLIAFRGLLDAQPGTVHQAGLAEFIRSGGFARHLRNMRLLYAERRYDLEQAIALHGPDVLQTVNSDFGLHLCCELPRGIDDRTLVRKLATEGIGATALSNYQLNPSSEQPGLILGFANTPSKHYAELIKKIKNQIELVL